LRNLLLKLSWFWNRLRCMSIPELAYRAQQAGGAWCDRIGLTGARKVPVANDLSRLHYEFDVGDRLDTAAYCLAADQLLLGKVSVFALHPADIGSPPVWNRDPLTGVNAPLLFGQHMAITDKPLVGDIKYLWEPNRHLHLVTLAQAYHLSGEQRYLDGIGLHISTWLAQCPYLMGVNWSSSLEPAIRLINWSLTWKLIGGANSPLFNGPQGEQLKQAWLASVYQHCHFVSSHLSAHSSANNHLIGELAGLYLGASTWPAWAESAKWQAKAKQQLVTQMQLQNSSDGVNLEQAIAYQQFVLDFFLLCGLAAKQSADDFPPAYWQRMESMMSFLSSIMDLAGHVPAFGDADDGFAVRLHTDPSFSPYQSLLATAAVLFNRADFAAKSQHFDEKSLWLLGQQGAQVFDQLSAQVLNDPIHLQPSRLDFPEGGYHIMGDAFGTENEIRLVVDCAPLGFLGIAAHGHADALSLVLSFGGQELLIDPGTYAYHAAQPWRDYFRGTSAHNTVRIDELDQSVSGGRFMWLHKARARCSQMSRSALESVFVGSHDGYQRLDDPVSHQRKIHFDVATKKILVTDDLSCSGQHLVEIFWHFSADSDVSIVDDVVLVRQSGKQLRLCMPSGQLTPSLFKGSEQPILGWSSPSYDVKYPSCTLRWKGVIKGSITFDTVLELSSL
jgi:hypothetical protein